MDVDVNDLPREFELYHRTSSIDEHLSNHNLSPIKKHARSASQRLSETKKKMITAHKDIDTISQSVLGESSLSILNKSENIDNDTFEKAKYFDEMVSAIKKKIISSDKITTTQLLTFAPESMPITKIMTSFDVTEYQAKKARKLYREKGVLAKPSSYKGKTNISEDTVNLVISFYQDDEFSRLMPGKKDFVSISKNVHEQKRLLLCNLKELHQFFKQKYPDKKIGISKFCTLKPKCCILPGANGTHSVCVCPYHQNTILLVDAMDSADTYKELLAKLVCSLENKECMFGRCENCPNQQILIDYLHVFFSDFDEDYQVIYKQWENSDRSTLKNMVDSVQNFIEKLVQSLEILRPHSFISKEQGKYLNYLKENLDVSNALFLGDFAENYSFVVQDEIQSFHWNNLMCTIHPVVIYYRGAESLSHKSYAIISDDNTHDVHFVLKVIELILSDLKNNMPNLASINFFTDGCAAQYKNRKTLFNLCQLEMEYQLKLVWNFHATSHGKSACDGIGGTVKRLTATESLKRPYKKQILTAKDMFDFCKENIPTIEFKFVPQEEMKEFRAIHEKRYDGVLHAIPGTRSYHQFTPISKNKIGAKRCSSDTNFECIHDFDKSYVEEVSVSIASYAAVVYDEYWWVGLVLEKNDEEGDVTMKFMHPKGPSKFYYWPQRDDICFIPNHCILKNVEVPTALGTARKYSLSIQDEKAIKGKWIKYLEARK